MHERVDAYRLIPRGKRLYTRRRETIERSFAHAKRLHGLRCARFHKLPLQVSACLAPPPTEIKENSSPWSNHPKNKAPPRIGGAYLRLEVSL
jgi:hypothetical protein